MSEKLVIDVVAGARPNFVKAAALFHAERASELPLPFRFRLISTGQHRAPEMADAFANELGLPVPHRHLGATGPSVSLLTADILARYATALTHDRPCATLVIGDVTSTLAAGLAAAQSGVPVIHLEAGLRSGDKLMLEETNRVIVDHLSDLLLTTTESASLNLRHEGISDSKICLVGNTVIDTLHIFLKQFPTPSNDRDFILLTLHRPENVDDAAQLKLLLEEVAYAGKDFNILFPIHPRTATKLDINRLPVNIVCIPPQTYSNFLMLLHDCKLLITDSGGASEEAFVLNKHCAVVRRSTERPETVEDPYSILTQPGSGILENFIRKAISESGIARKKPELWDGNAGQRITQLLGEWITVHNR